MAKAKIELKKFLKNIKGKDAVTIVYYSGHGMVDNLGKFYILPKDAYIESVNDLKDTGLPLDYIKQRLEKAPGYKALMIDACRLETKEKGRAVLGFGVSTPKLAVIFSTVEGQTSTMAKNGKYSAFTYSLYKTLKVGNYLDFDGSGYVELKELTKPLQKTLKEVSTNEAQKLDIKGDVNIPLIPVE